MLSINSITDSIYCLHFDSSEEMVRHFLRFSEWNESQNRKIYRSAFTMDQVLYEYRRLRGLDYFDTVGGFNVPVVALKEAAKQLPDLSIREKMVLDIITYLETTAKTPPEYLIGTTGDNFGEIEHEVAHGLFSTDPIYRTQMEILIDDMPLKILDGLYTFLKGEHYNESVYKDELQAYMATGFPYPIPNQIRVNKYRGQFMEVFYGTCKSYGIPLWEVSK